MNRTSIIAFLSLLLSYSLCAMEYSSSEGEDNEPYWYTEQLEQHTLYNNCRNTSKQHYTKPVTLQQAKEREEDKTFIREQSEMQKKQENHLKQQSTQFATLFAKNIKHLQSYHRTGIRIEVYLSAKYAEEKETILITIDNDYTALFIDTKENGSRTITINGELIPLIIKPNDRFMIRNSVGGIYDSLQ